MRRPYQAEVSERLQSKNFDEVFQVVEVHGVGDQAKAYTLSDLRGQREGLGFTQPIAAARLTPVELLPLTQESADAPTRILISDRGRNREATIKAQCVDGKVYIQYDDEEIEHVVDLSSLIYRWI